MESVLTSSGYRVRSESVHYYRPSTDPSDWAPDEFVWAEKGIAADRFRTRPQSPTVFALFAIPLILVIVGLLEGLVLANVFGALVTIFFGLFSALLIWMLTRNALYWSDFVVVAFQRSPETPPHTKDLAAQITGKITVTAGRLLSQDYQGRGGGRRFVRELYDSQQLDDVRTKVGAIFPAELQRLQ